MARVSTGLFPPLVAAYLLAAVIRRFGLRRGLTSVAAYGVGAIPALVLLGALNWWRYGSMLDLGYEKIPLDSPLLSGLDGLFLSPGKSIFLYAPVVLIGVLALPVAIRRRPPEVLLLLTASLANAVFWRPVQGRPFSPSPPGVGSISSRRSRSRQRQSDRKAALVRS